MKMRFVLVLVAVFAFTSCAQENQKPKYPTLSDSKVVVEGVDQWDANKPHTISVVEADKDGYKYWGYYGLSYYGGDASCRQAGLIRSNDLVHWDKYEGNPIVTNDCRWPSAVYANSTFYLFYAEYDNNNDSRIVMISSKDGIHFGDKEVVVERENGMQNQNPFMFFDKRDNNFYLTYYKGDERNANESERYWSIQLLKSKTVEGLKTATSKTLMKSKDLIAAPSITYYNNKYYLLIESRIVGKWDSKWVTLGYQCDTIDGQYEELDNEPPVLFDGDACAFQYVFGGELYIYYSHCLDLDKWNWQMRMVKAVK